VYTVHLAIASQFWFSSVRRLELLASSAIDTVARLSALCDSGRVRVAYLQVGLPGQVNEPTGQ